MTLHLDLLPLLVIMGGVAFMLGTRLLTARVLPTELGWWWIGFLASAELFMIGRLIQRSTLDPHLAVIAARSHYAIAAILAPTGIAALRRLIGLPAASGYVRLLVVAATLLAGLTLLTGLVFDYPATLRTDLIGDTYYAPRPGPGLALFAALAGLIGWAVWEALRERQRHADARPLRGGVTIVAGLFCLVGFNDVAFDGGWLASTYTFEYAFVGLIVVASFHEVAYLRDSNEALGRVVGERTTDLAARQQELEEAYATIVGAEERLRELAAASREGVLFCRGAVLVDANLAAERLLGQAVHGRAVLPLFAPADHAAIESLIRARGGPITVTALGPTGAPFVAEVVSAPHGAGSEDRTTALLLRDVTVEGQLQRRLLQADRLAALGTLAAGTAHEINNPLAYVIGNAEVLADAIDEATAGGAPLPPALAEAPALLHDMLDGAHRVRTIVRDLVAFAREPRVERGPADLERVLAFALAMANHQLRHRAQVVVELPALPAVHGDPSQLGQVFLNLLVNAAQAIPDGSAAGNQVKVAGRLEAAPPGDAPPMVVVEITDTGRGIDPATRDRLFDPFFTTKPPGQGTGLGLSICHGIVTALGGTIAIDGVPGRGTTVVVRLPAAAGPAVPAAVRQPAKAPTGRGRILIVEDEPLVARAMARVLTSHEIVLADSGTAALARLADESFDVILCDLMMPNLNGLELHATLEARDPALAARMCFITGGVFTEESAAFVARMEGRCLTKPVDAARLRATVAEALRRAP
jgi:signal transduction histidine kinase/CheY-like chemotaxis protein